MMNYVTYDLNWIFVFGSQLRALIEIFLLKIKQLFQNWAFYLKIKYV